MRYHVHHETICAYASPVLLAQHVLHLSPRDLPWQSCDAHRIESEPQASEEIERLDYFGNTTRHLVFSSPHESLTVRAQSTVEVRSRGGSEQVSDSPSWEEASEMLRALPPAGPLEAAEFVFASEHVGLRPELAQYAAWSFAPGRPLLDAALDLNRRIHEDFEFDPKATSISTPLAEVMARRRGVCQDFAHLMIGGLRALGFAARYVSGYVLTVPPAGHARLVGADASHAWVSVFCPQVGWVDFDPTNDCVVDDEHVTLGWGRDFGDVTPMRGVILGGGDQRLAVRVTVAPEGEAEELARAGSDAP
jgi:transglutaminase-like putative cysteine protease